MSGFDDGVPHIIHLAFDHPHDAAVSQIRVWSIQVKHVRKVGAGHPQIGIGFLAPVFCQVFSIDARNFW
jgi:hypothetical protein